MSTDPINDADFVFDLIGHFLVAFMHFAEWLTQLFIRALIWLTTVQPDLPLWLKLAALVLAFAALRLILPFLYRGITRRLMMRSPGDRRP